MIGGPNCVQSQDKSDKESAEIDYHLTCGEEQAEVAESPEEGSVLAKVKRAGQYIYG
jgi:hypothetical protein